MPVHVTTVRLKAQNKVIRLTMYCGQFGPTKHKRSARLKKVKVSVIVIYARHLKVHPFST